MTLRKIIAALFASGYCLTAAAAVVEGVVADRTTREPLIGATVLVEGTTKGTTTDALGHFGLDLPDGDHTLVVSYVRMSRAAWRSRAVRPGWRSSLSPMRRRCRP